MAADEDIFQFYTPMPLTLSQSIPSTNICSYTPLHIYTRPQHGQPTIESFILLPAFLHFYYAAKTNNLPSSPTVWSSVVVLYGCIV